MPQDWLNCNPISFVKLTQLIKKYEGSCTLHTPVEDSDLKERHALLKALYEEIGNVAEKVKRRLDSSS